MQKKTKLSREHSIVDSRRTLHAVHLTTCNTFRVVCCCWVVVHAALHELARPCAHEEGAVGRTPQLLHSIKSSKQCVLSFEASIDADLLQSAYKQVVV